MKVFSLSEMLYEELKTRCFMKDLALEVQFYIEFDLNQLLKFLRFFSFRISTSLWFFKLANIEHFWTHGRFIY